MGEYDWHTVSGKARLAALLLVLLSLIAFVIGGLILSSSVSAGTILSALDLLFIGSLWIAAGLVGIIISSRIREGDSLMWVVGMVIGIVVMLQTWTGVIWVNTRRGTFGVGSLLDAAAFLLALLMTILLLLALLDRDRKRPGR